MVHTRTRSAAFRAAIIAGAVLAGSLAVAAPAEAKTSASGGDFAVTVGGTTYNPAPGKDVKLRDVAPGARIAVRGIHVGFDIDVATLGVYDYTLTGAASLPTGYVATGAKAAGSVSSTLILCSAS